MDLVEITGFGRRLNYASFNVRFNLLKNDITRHQHLSLLFDIIITIIAAVLIIFIVISKIIIIIKAIGDSHYLAHYSWLRLVRRTVHVRRQSWVNWRKTVLASVELNRLFPHNFRVTDCMDNRKTADCRPDKERHLKSSGSIYKINLKNKIFSLCRK